MNRSISMSDDVIIDFLVAVYTSLHCLGYVLGQTYVCFKILNLCDPGCLSPNCPHVSNMFKKNKLNLLVVVFTSLSLENVGCKISHRITYNDI